LSIEFELSHLEKFRGAKILESSLLALIIEKSIKYSHPSPTMEIIFMENIMTGKTEIGTTKDF
jgi:hypothetical protein